MHGSLYTITTFARINTKRFFRDRLSIFFGILFPLIFLFVFGGIFGKTSANFHVAILNSSKEPAATKLVEQLSSNKAFAVDSEATTMETAKEKMSRSQLDAIIVLPDSFGKVTAAGYPAGEAKLLYTQNNDQAGQTLTSILAGGFKDLNKQITKAPEPFTVSSEKLQNRSLTSFDYTFSGLLGFALIGMGIFGPVNVFPELKKQGILRRLSTTSLKVWQYFCSIAISQTIVGLVSIIIMFIVAITVFKLQVVGNFFELGLFIIMSILMILGIGLSIGGWASNERQAAPLSNIVVFPMMFLSGTFFPRFLMPDWLQGLSAWLPLTPVIDGIRYIATEGAHLTAILPQVGMIAGWTVVVYLIAFRVFRWE